MTVKEIFRHPSWKVAGGLAGLVCILFYPVIFQGRLLGSPDSLGPYAGGVIFDQVRQAMGEYPLWQPWIFSGMPAAEAFTHISPLYFPYYIFKLFFIAGLWVHLVHFIWAGLGVYFLARHFQTSHRAAFLAGAGFMLTPYMVTMFVFGHGSQMMTAAYIPWVLWMTVQLFEKGRMIDVGLLAILLGFQLQRSHVQIAYYTWMLMGAYVLYQLVLAFKNRDRLAAVLQGSGLFLIAATVSIGIALLVYLPSVQYTPFSVRGGGAGGGAGYDYATAWSFHPQEMLTFLIPSALGFGGQTYWGQMPFTDYPNYMGVVILVLAVMGAVYRRTELTWFLAGTAVLALLISFGRHFSPVYDLFYNLFPYFNKFRVPHMILILLQFNVAVLAALGLSALLDLPAKTVPRWLPVAAVGVGIFLLVLVLGGSSLEGWLRGQFTPPRTQDPRAIGAINRTRWELWYRDAWVLVLFLGAFLGLLWLWIRRTITKPVLLSAVLALAVIDIIIVDFRIVQPGAGSGRRSQLIRRKAIQRYFQPDEVIRFLQTSSQEPFRIYPAGPLFGDSRFKAFGLESVGGYHPAKLKVYNEFLQRTGNIASFSLMRMLNVRYIISPRAVEHPELKPAFSGALKTSGGETTVQVYELAQALPRAWFVEELTTLENRDLIWTALNDPAFDPHRQAYLVTELEPGLKPAGRGKVTGLELSLHHLSLQTASDTRGFLVVSEVHFPLRWKVTLDGEPVPTYETNAVLRGIVVPPGEHRIEFHYDRSAFRLGVAISLVSCGLALGIVVAGLLIPVRRK